MAFDLVVRGGTVVDGSGLGAYRADVGVVGDRIAAIGRLHERGRQEIDADGLVVTPGFIDGHTHLDAQVFWDPLGANSWQTFRKVILPLLRPAILAALVFSFVRAMTAISAVISSTNGY